MIRTAILGGIFLILLSFAFTRNGQLSDVAQTVRNLAPVAVKEAVREPEPPQNQNRPEAAPVVAAPPESKPAIAPVHNEKEIVEAPVPAQEPPVVEAVEEPSRPVETAAVPVLPAPAAQPRNPAAPIPLVPPMAAYGQGLANSALLPIPATAAPISEEAAKPETAMQPSAEFPVVKVPARPIVTPWIAEPRAAEASASTADTPAAVAAAEADPNAPKFLTPDERSRDLHRLAREMEDTFISKLAR